MSDTDKIIEQSYYDPLGYGSAAKHLAHARKADASITMQDIQNWRRGADCSVSLSSTIFFTALKVKM